MNYNKTLKISVLISTMLLITVISGAVLLAACDGINRQDVMNDEQTENSNDGPADLEKNNPIDTGNTEGNVSIKYESKNDFPEHYKERFSGHIADLFTDAYSKYYQVKGFEFSNVEYVETNTSLEITFFLKMITQNYYKDPDTVEYIIEAKENNSKHYKQLYDEYNQPKESNFDMKFTAELNDGEIDADSIQLFTNVHPKGVEYVPIGEDFFP